MWPDEALTTCPGQGANSIPTIGKDKSEQSLRRRI